ncbi:hypothetical protein K6U06_22765 [Acidiferrimicrobium sp. IK]|uniref:hypothetical protein n=1 Tax=Acidiferrimicrobium sp. IK TaxID=2871700 RepID=UPI0021CB13CE|nr:hypothetical protein [Acidiferrimicrobium sp. IK]MCU4187203.1 hypothetical protein [Acidiferrimicrobium sp. IK]
MRSRCSTFRAADGSTVAVTSHASGDYDSIRAWAPMNPYLATPSGQAMLLDKRGEGATPLAPIVGRVPGSILTLDGRGVPLDAVWLEEIDEHPVPELPDLGSATPAVRVDLESRFEAVPFHRVRNWADYWALRSVEVDHLQRLQHLTASPMTASTPWRPTGSPALTDSWPTSLNDYIITAARSCSTAEWVAASRARTRCFRSGSTPSDRGPAAG